jgi:ferredoxin
MVKFEIIVKKDECIGCGACTTCDNFELNDKDNKAYPKKKIVDSLGCNEEAKDICPVECIKIKEIK